MKDAFDLHSCYMRPDYSNPRHVPIFIASIGSLVDIGYIELPDGKDFDADYCWELCNWISWAEKQPENLHSTISSCSHGVCFYDITKDEYHLALSQGFLVGDFETIMSYIIAHENYTFWGVKYNE